MGLRYLKRVNRFPAKNEAFADPYALSSLKAVASTQQSEYIDSILQAWHRPSGDNALLEDGIKNYDIDLPKRCVDGDYLAILKKTCDELRPKTRIIPLTLGHAAKHPNFPRTTSPGFPWVNQGYGTKSDVLRDKSASGHIHRAWDSIGRGIPWSLPDSLAFHRVVASEQTKTKVRPVWGYPTDVILEEARYFLPLLDHLKGHCQTEDAFYGLGMETARSGHAFLARCFEAVPGCKSLSADFSNFDAHVPAWLIRDLFAMMSDWFDFSKVLDSEGKVWNVKQEQTCRRWRAMVSYFINTKIRSPSGFRAQKAHGIPSGSMFTNLLDTMVNAVMMRTSLYRTTGELPAKDYYYGDDSQVFHLPDIDLDALASDLLSTFGAILSVDKTILSNCVENIHWLGYFYRPSGPSRSLDFILASTLFPEREVLSPIDACARLLGQMYSVMNRQCSLLFYDAIKWLQLQHSISDELLHAYVGSLPSKAFKYLSTLGLEMEDIKLPLVFPDPFGDRWIPSLMPQPCSRSFTPLRDRNLPDYAFTPEAYCNRAFRLSGFHDFDKYLLTLTMFDDPDSDEAYFSS